MPMSNCKQVVAVPAACEDRRGVFGAAKPAFGVMRFKRTITVNLNEEMADELRGILYDKECEAEKEGRKVPSHFYEFNTQLIKALDQKPPAKGEKPCPL